MRLDRYDREARALFPEDSWGARLAPGLAELFYCDVAAVLREKARVLESMRSELFCALRHGYCWCDECVATYRKWFSPRAGGDGER